MIINFDLLQAAPALHECYVSRINIEKFFTFHQMLSSIVTRRINIYNSRYKKSVHNCQHTGQHNFENNYFTDREPARRCVI
jgi:hypothetical protein